MKAIKEDRIADLLKAMTEKGRRVVAPVEEGDLVVFRPVTPESKLRPDVLRAVRS